MITEDQKKWLKAVIHNLHEMRDQRGDTYTDGFICANLNLAIEALWQVTRISK